MDDVFECTVLLQSLGDYASLNAVYAAFFDSKAPPARAAYQVAALPKGALTEIKCTAIM